MKVKGSKSVCGKSRHMQKGMKLYLYYDTKQCRIWACEHVQDIRGKPNILYVGQIDRYISMQCIVDMVVNAIRNKNPKK